MRSLRPDLGAAEWHYTFQYVSSVMLVRIEDSLSVNQVVLISQAAIYLLNSAVVQVQSMIHLMVNVIAIRFFSA